MGPLLASSTKIFMAPFFWILHTWWELLESFSVFNNCIPSLRRGQSFINKQHNLIDCFGNSIGSVEPEIDKSSDLSWSQNWIESKLINNRMNQSRIQKTAMNQMVLGLIQLRFFSFSSFFISRSNWCNFKRLFFIKYGLKTMRYLLVFSSIFNTLFFQFLFSYSIKFKSIYYIFLTIYF